MLKIDRTGETKIMNCGFNATIIEYINGDNITVQFEDGVVIKNREYKEFKHGAIKHPSLSKYFSNLRVGEERMMNCGLKAKIIQYDSADNITVQFEDGTIKSNKRYVEFKNGVLSNVLGRSNKLINRVGEVAVMNCGLKATIIKFKNTKNITVQFEDGLLKKTNYGCFKKGTISHSEKATNIVIAERIGEVKYMNNGLKAKIIKYNNKNDIDVEFEDGAVVQNRTYGEFLKRKIASPNLSAKGISHFCGFTCQVIIKSESNVY